jgi:putative FmdB family regulatory protein
MPTYEYECDACEHLFEEFQSMRDEPLTKCPQCGKKKLRRLFGSGAAILFRGTGFYQTDYRSESYKAAAKKDGEASSSGTTGTTGNATGDSGSKPKGKSAKSTSQATDD